MPSGLQIKMARIALGWDASDLANTSGVALTTVSRIENGGGAYASTVAKLQAALESAGAVFIADRQPSLDGGPGVRLANADAVVVLGRAGRPAKARATGRTGRRKRGGK